jgi:hypothetical protein
VRILAAVCFRISPPVSYQEKKNKRTTTKTKIDKTIFLSFCMNNGRTKFGREECAEENICNKEVENNRKVDKIV